MSQSEELIAELESSDFVVIGTPMHNFTVPSALKAWIDHIVRVRRTFNVTPAGKVAICATVQSLSPCPRAEDFRRASASAGFSDAVSEGHPGHHRTA